MNKKLLIILILFSNYLYNELETDRPDVTESAYNVEKGLFQFETSIFNYSKDKSSSERTYLDVTSKYGVSNDTDIQFVTGLLNSYDNTEIAFEDLIFRIKHNLKKDKFGIGLLPFFSYPRKDSNEKNFGLALPCDFPINDRYSIGFMPQITKQYGEENQIEYLNTLAFGII